MGSFQKGKGKKEKLRKGEWKYIKNWEPFMLNLFFMLGLPEIFSVAA